MIAEAKRLNADLPNATFQLNPWPDLRLIDTGSVDLFYSRLVFQHMDPELTLAYVGDLGRILAAGGVAIFQVPSAPAARTRASTMMRSLLRPFGGLPGVGPRMSMFAVPPEQIRRTVADALLTLVATTDDAGALPLPSYLYIATRPD